MRELFSNCVFVHLGHFKTVWGQIQRTEPSSAEAILQCRQPDWYTTLQRRTLIGQTASICQLILKAQPAPQERLTRSIEAHQSGLGLEMIPYDLIKLVFEPHNCQTELRIGKFTLNYPTTVFKKSLIYIFTNISKYTCVNQKQLGRWYLRNSFEMYSMHPWMLKLVIFIWLLSPNCIKRPNGQC